MPRKVNLVHHWAVIGAKLGVSLLIQVEDTIPASTNTTGSQAGVPMILLGLFHIFGIDHKKKHPMGVVNGTVTYPPATPVEKTGSKRGTKRGASAETMDSGKVSMSRQDAATWAD